MTTDLLPDPSSHDLRLPEWGPYNKKYNGIAHIADPLRGIRFELSVFPACFRHRMTVPNVQWESGYHPWEASAGLGYFSYRYDLEWRDRVYCDVAFFTASGEPETNARLIRTELVNDTDLPQHMALHYVAYLCFPPLRPYSHEPIIPAEAGLPSGAVWVDALDYADLRYATPRPSDNLVYEGWLRGEIRDHGFVGGAGIGRGFGGEAGDRARYALRIPHPFDDAELLVRYRARAGRACFQLRGVVDAPLILEPAADLELRAVALGPLQAGEHALELVSVGACPVELDGFVVVERGRRDSVRFTPRRWDPVARLDEGPAADTLLIRYADLRTVYGLAWTGPISEVRQYFTSELDRTMPYFVNEHVQKELHSDDGGHFTNVFIRPIVLEPRSRTVLFGMACNGNEEEVRRILTAFTAEPQAREAGYAHARQTRAAFTTNPSGQGYLFSQERMAATLLTNVVYPVYTRRRFIRHFTPGKWWDCLYTWDSGFISMGLLDIDLQRSIDCLNAYTTPPGDEQAAFIHHGSPVPVQIYACQELWNRTRSRELLEYFYPRLRQFYLFLAGRLGSSTTRTLKSNLLKTWDYFYNSAGWDDYPPQVHVRTRGLEGSVTPVVTTAHMIRSARILQQAAAALGRDADAGDYQSDVDMWRTALNRHAWDEEAGVFSYVVHDADGSPVDILRHESGENLNLGFDGVSPLFAGICTPAQERRLYERIESGRHLWTPVGLTAVDQSAAYYRADGYWNGTVWFPYQWFIWKSLLDLGYGDMAFRIARTALDIWRDEVAATHNCFEHFLVSSRRGAGWHHFGGLSSPILAWFRAYHRPGAFTCGYETWVESLSVAPDTASLQADVRHASDGRAWLALAVMSPDRTYAVSWNGAPVSPRIRHEGTLEIPLIGSGRLEIAPREG